MTCLTFLPIIIYSYFVCFAIVIICNYNEHIVIISFILAIVEYHSQLLSINKTYKTRMVVINEIEDEDTFSPQVLWAQRKDTISLKVNVAEAKV